MPVERRTQEGGAPLRDSGDSSSSTVWFSPLAIWRLGGMSGRVGRCLRSVWRRTAFRSTPTHVWIHAQARGPPVADRLCGNPPGDSGRVGGGAWCCTAVADCHLVPPRSRLVVRLGPCQSSSRPFTREHLRFSPGCSLRIGSGREPRGSTEVPLNRRFISSDTTLRSGMVCRSSACGLAWAFMLGR